MLHRAAAYSARRCNHADATQAHCGCSTHVRACCDLFIAEYAGLIQQPFPQACVLAADRQCACCRVVTDGCLLCKCATTSLARAQLSAQQGAKAARRSSKHKTRCTRQSARAAAADERPHCAVPVCNAKLLRAEAEHAVCAKCRPSCKRIQQGAHDKQLVYTHRGMAAFVNKTGCALQTFRAVANADVCAVAAIKQVLGEQWHLPVPRGPFAEDTSSEARQRLHAARATAAQAAPRQHHDAPRQRHDSVEGREGKCCVCGREPRLLGKPSGKCGRRRCQRDCLPAFRMLKTVLNDSRCNLLRDRYGEDSGGPRHWGPQFELAIAARVAAAPEFFASAAWVTGDARARLEALLGETLETFFERCPMRRGGE